MARELGVRKLTAFPLQSGGTYGDAFSLKNCVSLNTTDNYDEYENKSDCTIEESKSTYNSTDIELVMSSNMALELLAKTTGQKYANGKISFLANPEIPQFALAYEILMSDNSVRRRVLYNCNLKKEEWNNETESEGEEWTFTGKAIPIEYEGELYVHTILGQKEINAIADPETKAKYQAEFDNFFTKIVMPGEPDGA